MAQPLTNVLRPLSPSGIIEGVQIHKTVNYIHHSWIELTRTLKDLPVAVQDLKVPHDPHRPWPLYISPLEDRGAIQSLLEQTLSEEELMGIDLRVLPEDPNKIQEHGLLFLPYPYIVPGGRFNEMYGWDSYFILLGLLEDGRLDLAKGIVENYLYEIRHYGKILNANRTYYLGRSQPPFLTRAVLEVYGQTKDTDWLRRVLPGILGHYRFWTSPPHTLEDGGLSRYYALGKGPAPEVVWSEIDELGKSHYDRIKSVYQQKPTLNYDLGLFYDAARDELTDLFYTGDRSIRESGFDPTSRFGEFGVDVVHYFPVCLNTLLYVMETDLASIYRILEDPQGAEAFEARAARRKRLINSFFWNDEDGLYYDFRFLSQSQHRYPFLTTFYPLWAGIASKEQALRVASNLKSFETDCGLQASLNPSGNQWDAPFGWPPLQWIAIQGLLKFGFEDSALRIASKYVRLVSRECVRTGTIREKYNLKACDIEVREDVQFGYLTNEVGFGWTNGVYLKLLPLIIDHCMLY